MTDSNQHTDSEQISKTSPEGGSHKLAAIMFTDIKGFSKRMQENEAAAIRMLEVHNRMMRETVERYRGLVVKTIGDAFLVSFDSVVDATSCAIDAQQRFRGYNKGRPKAECITTRIGVHLGDVIVKDKDVFGDGVNIASRLQSMAEPGGVNISDSVYQQIKNKLDVHVVRLGAPQLKNIKEAVKVYQVIIVPRDRARGRVATHLYVAKTLMKRKRSQRLLSACLALAVLAVWAWYTFWPGPALGSIAVLPFENLGPKEQEYLADGLTEEIISQLGKLPDVLVISKSSSFELKGSNLTNDEIVNRLRTQHLLRGSLRTKADEVEVSVHLFDAAKGKDEWTHAYRVAASDVYQLQFEIPRQIAERFRLELRQKDGSVPATAHDLYFRGLYEDRRLERAASLAAIGYYSQALAIDSDFVAARVGLAKNHVNQYNNQWDKSSQRLNEAERQARRVLSQDSTNSEAIAVIGQVQIHRGNRDAGIASLNQALHYNPHNYVALMVLGQEYLLQLGDPETGLSYFRRALETNPTNFALACNIGGAYAMLRNYTEATAAFRRAIALNPNYSTTYLNLATAFWRQTEYDSAIAYYRLAIQKDPSYPDTYELLGELLLALDRASEAESLLGAGVRLGMEDFRVCYLWGVALRKLNRIPEATKVWGDLSVLLRKLVAADPVSTDYLAYNALVLARLGRTGEAEATIEQALRIGVDDSEVHLNAARIFSLIGDRQRMISSYRRAHQMNPEYDAVYLAFIIDLAAYKNDPDLLAAVR